MQASDPSGKRSAWILGFVAAFCAGPYPFPVNLQATVVYGTMFMLLWMRIPRQRGSVFYSAHGFFAVGLVLAAYFAFTTNTWVVMALHFSVLFLASDLILRQFSDDRYQSIGAYVIEIWALIRAFLVRFFSRSTVADFLSFQSAGSVNADGSAARDGKRMPVILVSAVSGIFLAYIFHLLFSRVNEDYAKFMGAFMEWVWSVLLRDLLFAIPYSYVLFSLLGAKGKPRQTSESGKRIPVVSAVIALFAVVLVTAVFSIFQTKLIIVDVPELKFSDLSQYTQKGFIQLVCAIVMGYCVALVAFQTKLQAQTRVRWLLALILVFIAELMLATGFSAHKLFLLQYVFGFKDERILASIGILFILFSFLILIARSFSKRTTAGFRHQVGFLLIAVVSVNVFSIDTISSTLYPIRYFKDGMAFHDYSYLLGNSYDNVQEWPRIMDEMTVIDPPLPGPGYFWGHESKGRSDMFGGSYTPLCADSDLGLADSGLEQNVHAFPTRLITQAYQKYAGKFSLHAENPGTLKLESFLDFNVRQHRAFRFAKSDLGGMRRSRKYLIGYCAAEAVSSAPSSELIPYRKGDKWGFADRWKRLVVSPQYARAWPLREGLARVELDQKWGFVDRTGRNVVPLKYDGADDFAGGLARVYLNGKWGFVNGAGNEVIAVKHDAVSRSGSQLLLVKLKGKWGVVDSKGQEVIAPRFTSIALDFSEDMILVQLDGKYGFFDKKGAEVIAPTFDLAHPFHQGLAAFFLDKWGFTNPAGTHVIAAIYDQAGDFHGGLAAVKRNEKWGYVDKAGREVIPLKYDDVDNFSEGAAAVLLNGKWGFVDATGREIIAPEYEMVGSFSEGLARVRLHKLWGFVNTKGRVVIPLIHSAPADFKGGTATTTSGCIDKSGHNVVLPRIHEAQWASNDCPSFYEGLARVRRIGGGYGVGFADNAGRVVIPMIYDSVGDFVGGIARVTRVDKSGYIDRNGVEYWEDVPGSKFPPGEPSTVPEGDR